MTEPMSVTPEVEKCETTALVAPDSVMSLAPEFRIDAIAVACLRHKPISNAEIAPHWRRENRAGKKSRRRSAVARLKDEIAELKAALRKAARAPRAPKPEAPTLLSRKTALSVPPIHAAWKPEEKLKEHGNNGARSGWVTLPSRQISESDEKRRKAALAAMPSHIREKYSNKEPVE